MIKTPSWHEMKSFLKRGFILLIYVPGLCPVIGQTGIKAAINEEISYDDKTFYLDIIHSINSLKSTDIYSCVYYHNDEVDLNLFYEYYNYCLKYKIFN